MGEETYGPRFSLLPRYYDVIQIHSGKYNTVILSRGIAMNDRNPVPVPLSR